MATDFSSVDLPISEQVLQDLSKSIVQVIPKFSEQERDSGVKELHAILGPLLDTADTPNISPGHRAAACNFICAIVERCQVSDVSYAREAILDDFIWNRLFNIYLDRSDDAKSKSVRQVLLVLTNVLSKSESPRSLELRRRATTTFLDIICRRQDRLKVKPALQGLAHFLQKDVVGLQELLDIYQKLVVNLAESTGYVQIAQNLMSAVLAWIVHHDTSLSAGHLLKNLLAQLRNSPQFKRDQWTEPTWVLPVIQCLRRWPDRMQEVKTHVFPHCFLPELDEYLYFLSFLHLERHMGLRLPPPASPASNSDWVNGLDKPREFRVFLAAIEKGKELGIVKDVDSRLCKNIEIKDNALHLPDSVFEGWLSHIEPEVRLAGMYLSIYSTAVTKPFTGEILRSLKRNLVHLHADADANFRRELVGYVSKLFDRLRGSTATLARPTTKAAASQTRLPIPKACYQATKDTQNECFSDPLVESFRFVVWYVRFIEAELRVDASYQKRISALRTLGVVLKSGLDPRVPHRHLSKRAQGQLQWMHQLQIPNIRLCRALLDLIMDPYDDIRDASVSTLQLCLEAMPEEQRTTAIAGLPQFITRAEAAMMRTGRADHADCVARAYALYYSTCKLDLAIQYKPPGLEFASRFLVLRNLNQQLKDTLSVARKNMSEAVNGRPVHGIYAAIRYIVDNEQFYGDLQLESATNLIHWSYLHKELLQSFDVLWTCVRETLCADAPEGHVPDDLEEEMSLDTKEILSYSWRGLKEASVLLRAIATRAPIGKHDRALVSLDAFRGLGMLCFRQLIELRHRGAFSTVAQTFAAFCRRCVAVEDASLRSLPEAYYEATLSSIQAKSHAITRRSGGIPALMSGIIAAEPQPGGKLFARAMKDLIAEVLMDAQSTNIEESRLPQVHALNCIKDIFMTSRLSLPSEAYIGEGLELAAKTLNSKIWPIRNCSLMLFKALIERLLGSDEAQDWKEQERTKTSRFSYDNYPSLIGILKSLLDPEGPIKASLDTPESNSPMDLHGAEGVFPALQILRQATPPEEHRRDILASVQKLLGSSHWHLRDMAASTAATLLRSAELVETFKSLLTNTEEPTNKRHGTLLSAKNVLRRIFQETPPRDLNTFEQVLQCLIYSVTHKYFQDNCPFTQAAFLDLVALCGMAMVKRSISPDAPTFATWCKLEAIFSTRANLTIVLGNALDDALLRSSLTKVFMIDSVLPRPESLISGPFQLIEDALISLETFDLDTCAIALDTLHSLLRIKKPQGSVSPEVSILIPVFRFMRQTQNPELLAKAQSLLADGLSRGLFGPHSILGVFPEDDILATLRSLESQCLSGAPSSAHSALHLLAHILDYTFAEYYDSHRLTTTLPYLARYTRILRTTLVDTNPFDARAAAAHGVAALAYTWTLRATSKAEAPVLLGLVFVLYDLLTDDDDEIRGLGAVATSRLLANFREGDAGAEVRAGRMPKMLPSHEGRYKAEEVPMRMVQRLAHFLVKHFGTSQYLYKEAVRRLTASPSGAAVFPPRPFKEMLAEARKEDSALFVAEKQNLYFDLTLDAVTWAHVLSSLQAPAPTNTLRTSLEAWVTSALTELLRTAGAEKDGAAGWTSKGDVFTLGMRGLSAAHVVVKWQGSEGPRIRKLLGEFVGTGKWREVHGLWVRQAEWVLEGGVVDVLKVAHGRVRAVQRGLFL